MIFLTDSHHFNGQHIYIHINIFIWWLLLLIVFIHFMVRCVLEVRYNIVRMQICVILFHSGEDICLRYRYGSLSAGESSNASSYCQMYRSIVVNLLMTLWKGKRREDRHSIHPTSTPTTRFWLILHFHISSVCRFGFATSLINFAGEWTYCTYIAPFHRILHSLAESLYWKLFLSITKNDLQQEEAWLL